MRSALVLLAAVMLPPVAEAQLPAPPNAQAYFEFMLARHLENQGDEAGALEALKRAADADPKSADIKAEFASLYARQNKAPEAVEAAEQALAIDPDNVEAHRILGLVYSAWSDGGLQPPRGRTPAELRDVAVDHLRKILDTPTVATDLNLRLTLGRLELRAGRPEKAIPVLEGVVSQSPFVVEPYTLLADARLAVGRTEEAAEALEMAAEIDPRRYIPLAELYERLNKWPEAAEAYGSAIEAMRTPTRELRLRYVSALLNIPGGEGAAQARDFLKEFLITAPQDAQALYLLSTAHRQLQDLAAAEETARKLLSVDPTSVAALNALSAIYFDRHDPKKVIELLTPFEKEAAGRGKGREREAAMALSQLGFAHLQLGAHQQAIAAFNQARTFAPKDLSYELYLVQAYVTARQFPRAVEASADALTRHPGDARLVRLRARALVGAGRKDEAVKSLQDAIAKSPEDLELTLALGSTFEELGRIPDAEREFRRIIEKDPVNADALNYLGYMLADRGLKLPEAVSLIERALQVEPENPAYLDSLGWALFKQGKAEEAEEPLRKAAAALVAQSVIQDHLGDVLARRGKHDEAIAAWERALSGDGEDIDRGAIEKKIKEARGRKR